MWAQGHGAEMGKKNVYLELGTTLSAHLVERDRSSEIPSSEQVRC